MGKLKNEYKSFLDDIEKNIKNKDDLEYIKGRFVQFLDVMLEEMDRIMEYKEEEIKKLESTQKNLDDRMNKMQEIVDNIEKDIYSEDGFDFEIVCPYCNYEFIIDVDENKTEIECPECNNIIELDWSGGDPEEDIYTDDEVTGCQAGGCSTCAGCGAVEDEEDEENEENEEESNNEDTPEQTNENDDDM